jgi:P27 family predicted phage terminase small subunit
MATGRPNGRPPKPVEQKRATGNPGKRTLKTAPLPGEGLAGSANVPSSPDLGPAGLALWVHVWEAGRSWLSPDSDRTIITLLCQAQDEAELLRTGINSGEYPRVYTHANGSIVTSPYVSQLKELRTQITSWLAAIGFSPSDRSRLGLAEVRVRDELDELQRRRDERATGSR